MSTIDIRNTDENPVDVIIFADSLSLIKVRGGEVHIYEEDAGDAICVSKEGIDNLIKALQKAKEIWK